jgi:hypothetical protein
MRNIQKSIQFMKVISELITNQKYQILNDILYYCITNYLILLLSLVYR